MTWTPDQVITLASIVSALVIGVGGWFVVSKLNKANTEKAKAETAAIYQKMASESADREAKQHEEIEGLRKTIAGLEQRVEYLTETNKKKDDRILDLENLSNKQEKRIKELERSNSNLEQEVQALRLKRK